MPRGPLVLALLIAGCAETPREDGTVIYLHRAGITVTPGVDDAARAVSSLVERTTTIAPAAMGDAAFDQVLACVSRAFSPFAVDVVGEPPTRGDYTMAVLGGDGTELGRGADQHGLAPMDTTSCATVPNAIAFVFTDNLGSDTARACDVAVHELAHVFSVDHQLLSSEPTSYLPFSGVRAFQDVEAPCGETTARPCACGGSTQSSFRVLLDRLGPSSRVDVEPPRVEVEAVDGARGSLVVHVRASDGAGIGAVSLRVCDATSATTSTCGDGVLACTSRGAEYTFVMPSASGKIKISAVAVDMVGNRGESVELSHEVQP